MADQLTWLEGRKDNHEMSRGLKIRLGGYPAEGERWSMMGRRRCEIDESDNRSSARAYSCHEYQRGIWSKDGAFQEERE
jgi:hypothetical protein